jgi:predicted phosphodiesterase
MRLWVLSDLQLELSPQRQRPRFDVLVIAGDTTTHVERGVRWLLEHVSDGPPLCVLGNHEAYDAAHSSSLDELILTLGDQVWISGHVHESEERMVGTRPWPP